MLDRPEVLRIVPERGLPPHLDARIRLGLCRCFPADQATFAQARAWHGSGPAYSVVMEMGQEVIAHVGVVDRVIEAGGSRLRIGGVQNVFVVPEARGRGLVERIMAAAMAEARARGMDCGLLFCIPQLEHVYARCGWRTITPESVTRVMEDGSEGPLPGKNIAMFFPIQCVRFPAGRVHLGGNDW